MDSSASVEGATAGTRDQSNDNKSPQPPQRGSRIRLACSRCQKRKIKCDGQHPTCSACKKAGAVCSSGVTTRGHPKAYINSLWNRIRWLESAVEGAPEIDLSDAPPIDLEQQHWHGAESSIPPVTPGQNPNHEYHDSVTVQGSGGRAMDSGVDSTDAATPNADGFSNDPQQQPERVSEIGLVSVGAGQDLRYVGPSSGYAFAKLLLKVTGAKPLPRLASSSTPTQSRLGWRHGDVPTCTTGSGLNEALLAAQEIRIAPAPLPTKMEHAVQLSSVYWETLHPQYPFLHQPTHLKRLEHVYNSDEASCKPVFKFQAFMMLAISATILSHRYKTKVLSAEGLAASAMQAFEKLQVEGSLEGLQCLLLLTMYALVNPSSRLNAWYINYQCIAAVLDLGLQRDVRRNLSLLTREMRTRIFWVVYSLDRSLATALGRPIGLRDEACDLRLPLDIEDEDLLQCLQVSQGDVGTRQPIGGNQPPGAISYAIHLIKLAILNSEIKYVGHSISSKTPSYCYPGVADISAWHSDMLRRLDEWAAEIQQNCPRPRFLSNSEPTSTTTNGGIGNRPTYLSQLAHLRYHEARILLLRPSPAVHTPTTQSLRTCHASAAAVVRITLELYRDDALIYSWPTIHALFLAAITNLYCVCAIPDLAEEVASGTLDVDALQAQLASVSNVLSAAAETWPDAKRTRDVLDDVARSTVRWLRRRAAGAGVDSFQRGGQQQRTRSSNNEGKIVAASKRSLSQQRDSDSDCIQAVDSAAALQDSGLQEQQFASYGGSGLDMANISASVDPLFAFFENVEEPTPGTATSTAAMDLNSIMQGIYRDYQPAVDFDVGFDAEVLANYS